MCIALLEPRATDPHHTQPSSPAGSATGLPIGSPGAGGGFLGGSPGGASLSASSELRRMSEVTAKVGPKRYVCLTAPQDTLPSACCGDHQAAEASSAINIMTCTAH